MCRRDHGWLSELLAAHEAEKRSLRGRIDSLRAELADARAPRGPDVAADAGVEADSPGTTRVPPEAASETTPGRRCDRALARRG